MEIIHIRQRLEELPDELYEAEIKYNEADAEYKYLEDMKKPLLANLKMQFSGSNPERETKALASPEYKKHLEGLYEALKVKGKRQAEFHRLQNEFDAMRSLNKNIL